ncbi:hypothetical protein J4T90_05065 (plasmid) [Sinorhizobium medicae]|nr:hypothetical protein [Sinorhizobium medicae]
MIKIMKGHPNSQLDDLLAWAYAASTMPATVRRPLATGDAR